MFFNISGKFQQHSIILCDTRISVKFWGNWQLFRRDLKEFTNISGSFNLAKFLKHEIREVLQKKETRHLVEAWKSH